MHHSARRNRGSGSQRKRDEDESGEQFLASLTAYLEAHGFRAEPATPQAEVRYTTTDRIWFGMLIAGLLLLGTLIPERLFQDARYKDYFEKLLTWAFAAGLFTQWVKSPSDLLLLIRRWPFRVVATGLLLGCLLFVVEVVRVDVLLQPGSELAASDTGDVMAPSFRTHLSSRDFVVRDVQRRTALRPFALSLWEMLGAGLHPTPNWRLLYKVVFSCPNRAQIVASFREGDLDERARNDLQRQGITVTERRVVTLDVDGSREVLLPYGRYDMQLVSPCHHALDLLDLQSPKEYDFTVKSCLEAARQ